MGSSLDWGSNFIGVLLIAALIGVAMFIYDLNKENLDRKT